MCDNDKEDPHYILFQLPHTLPIDLQHSSSTAPLTSEPSTSEKTQMQTSYQNQNDIDFDKDTVDNAPTTSASNIVRGCRLDELPSSSSPIGKLLVYDDGSVQMKIGDVYFDIESGSSISICQHLLNINLQERTCAFLGNVTQRAVVMPDIDGLLQQNDISDDDGHRDEEAPPK